MGRQWNDVRSFKGNDASERIQIPDYIAEEMITRAEFFDNGMDTGRYLFVIQRINQRVAQSADCADVATSLNQLVYQFGGRVRVHGLLLQ
ncbi:hypothetical protein ATCR1_14851 [Agrobacterium tumefaciens CCNWGS0286]|nr:hypothetical protein ATCR1_14851 [Agrobacterium tumefaciens CCNWGS0286]